MTDWKHKVDIKDLHSKYQAGELTPPELGKEVAKRLRKLSEWKYPPISEHHLQELADIIDDFENCVDTIDEYDGILDNLYDWADTPLPHSANTPFSQIPKLCWVNTF